MDPVPSISVTNPQRVETSPAYPLSPARSNSPWDGEFRRPTSPASKQGASRPTSPGAAASKVFRALSGNVPGLSSIKDATGPQLEMTVTVDPLSQQIFDRTGEPPVATRQNSDDTSHSVSETEHPRPSRSPGTPPRLASGHTTQARQAKSKDKGVSFLSRIRGVKKKEYPNLSRDDASVAESRPEGHDAEIFSPVSRDAEFDVAVPQAPNYIRIRARHTKKKVFDSLFLAQELRVDAPEETCPAVRRKPAMSDKPTIWAAEFSKDGRFLATAGHDKVVRVWAVLGSPEERHAELRRNSASSQGSSSSPLHFTAQVFKSRPIREYAGHTSTILDLSWSNNNFLLSSSMDKTVRLWHVSRDQCLCTFKHADFVPAVVFHPKDDRFFLAGSLDCKIRMWSIPEKRVAHWHQTSEMITALAFSPDGKTVIAGSAGGLLTFYEAEGLRYQTQIRAKSAHGKNSKGSKITGIQTLQHPLNSTNGDVKVIVTSNDSRVRLFNFRDKSVELKMKGCENNSSQIRASISDDQRFICCGSEDNRAYIWPLNLENRDDPTKRPLEHFQAHNTAVTCVRFAPTKTRHLLSKSMDPIYDLCSPQTSGYRMHRTVSQASSKNPGESVEFVAPEPVRQQTWSHSATSSSHPGGNVIVTCSVTGAIKVFRQDCAHRHRPKPSKVTLSTSRPSSLRTRSSNRSLQSGCDSVNTQPAGERILSWRSNISDAPSVRTGSIGSRYSTRSSSPRKSGQLPRSASNPIYNKQPAGMKTPTDSFVSSGTSTPAGSASQSPHLINSDSLKMTKIADGPRQANHRVVSGPAAVASPSSTSKSEASRPFPIAEHGRPPPPPPPPEHKSRKENAAARPDLVDSTAGAATEVDRADGNVPPPSSSHATKANPLMLVGEQSNLFWDVEAHRERAKRLHRVHEAAQRERREVATGTDDGTGLGLREGLDGGLDFRPTMGRSGESFVSRLTIERSDDGESEGSSFGKGSLHGEREMGQVRG